jgi:hypothetical protein
MEFNIFDKKLILQILMEEKRYHNYIKTIEYKSDQASQLKRLDSIIEKITNPTI